MGDSEIASNLITTYDGNNGKISHYCDFRLVRQWRTRNLVCTNGKFLKIEEDCGKRTWDVVMVRYFENLTESDWSEDIRKNFSSTSDCKILRWHALGKLVYFVATGHILHKVDVSPIHRTEREGGRLFIYNPWTTTTLFSKIPVVGHSLVTNS